MTTPDPAVLAAVQDLLARYAHAMDQRKLDDCIALFDDNAVLSVTGDTHTGKAAIRAWMDGIAEASPPGRHLTVNITVDSLGDNRYIAEADFALVRPGEGAPTLAVIGRYYDEVGPVDDTWRFLHRTITIG
jgi:uncharacterized protein (TIGR02246 family)